MNATRRARLIAIGDTHALWVTKHLAEASRGFDPEGTPKGGVYNQHHVDIDADGEAQDAFFAAVAEVLPAPEAIQHEAKPIAAHLKGQHNQDSHGNDHAMPNLGALDKLKLAGRIQLGEGEKLAASQVIPSSPADWKMPAAVIDGPQGRELRLGFVMFEDTNKWSAADKGGTVKLGRPEMGALSSKLQEIHVLGERRRKDINAGSNDNDDTFAIGVLPGGEWGDIHYIAEGSADGDGGWQLDLRRRPPDAPADWEPDYGYEPDAPVTFGPKHTQTLVKLLDRFEALPENVKAKFDPSQKRDSDGQWTDGMPGSAALDKLKLASRIHLKPGESLVGSRKFKSSDSSSWDLLAAEVDTPGGREVRLGVVNPDDSKRWSAGPNPKTAARVAAIDSEMDALNEQGESTWTDAQSGRYEELGDERGELESEADELGMNRTATLTPDGAGQLRAGIAAGAERGQAHQKEYQAFWDSPDGLRLTELGDIRDRDRDRRGMIPPESQARFDAEHGEEFRRLWAMVPDSELVFAEGVIPSPDSRDLVWSVEGWDSGEGDWQVVLGVRPTDPELLDGWYPGANDDAARFEPKDVKALLSGLGELAGNPVTAVRRRRSR